MASALNYAASVQSDNPQMDKAMLALIHSESRGNPGARSPANAWGSTQVLDSTGAELARELKVPWRPDLMHSSSPQAIPYQYMLGRRYLEKGLGRYKNWADAFRFYHGGYDQRGWKQVTNTYAAYNVEKMRQLGVL
ncbi:MAG TPA: transglycosylase SLT domain-containing protein [Rhizobacter sp.]|jgi:soluble lytic murein transglycosylase-like protein|nr:transglycosylase SLT domain-containing protein [Rhizobacter sp.]